MEKQEVKSKWDELAREIGAQISPEKEQLVESPPVDESTDTTRPKSRSTARPPAPKRLAGWDNLANEFGLPAPEPAAEPDIDTVVTVTRSDVAEVTEVESPGRERQPEELPPRAQQDRSRQRREGRSREREDVNREPTQELGRRARGGRRQERRDDRPQRGHREERRPRPPREQHEEREEHVEREPRQPREERSKRERHEYRGQRTERQQREERESREDSRLAEPKELREETSKPAPTVSLWQKIFGSPVEPAVPSESPSNEAEEKGGTTDLGNVSTSGEDDDFRASSIAEDVTEIEARGEAPMEFEAAVDESDLSETRQRRPRRRRRGRGGKGGRGADVKSSESRRRVARDEPVHEDDFDELIPGDDDLDAESDGPLADGAEDTDEQSDGESDRPISARGRAALQRSIPSWDEAIGYIVDLNMQARSQRRQSSHSGSRSGPTRGRAPRGRRKS